MPTRGIWSKAWSTGAWAGAGSIVPISNESVGITEAEVRRGASVREAAEDIGITEGFVKWAREFLFMPESVGITEDSVRRQYSIRMIAEALGILGDITDAIYEYYNVGYTGAYTAYGDTWRAQTFTPSVDHELTHVKLQMYRVGSPGVVTVGIQLTDVDGKPVSPDLCTGTTNGNTLTTDTDGEWRDVSLAVPLIAGAKYAIVVRVLSGGPSDRISWNIDTDVASYAGGEGAGSNNGGAIWSLYANSDFMFEEWSNPREFLKRMISVRETIESVAITEAKEAWFAAIRFADDAIGITEGAVKKTLTWLVKVASEAVGITEGAVRRLYSIRFTPDAVGLTEGLVRRLRSIRFTPDTEAITDGSVRRSWAVRMAAETVNITEGGVKKALTALVKISSEAIGLTEAVVRRGRSIRMTVESVALTELGAMRLYIVRLMAEAIGITEAGVRRMRIVKLMAESVGITEVFVAAISSVAHNLHQLISAPNRFRTKLQAFISRRISQ